MLLGRDGSVCYSGDVASTCFFYVEGASDAVKVRDAVNVRCKSFLEAREWGPRAWCVVDVQAAGLMVGLNYSFDKVTESVRGEVLEVLRFIKGLSVELATPFVVGVDGEDRDVIGRGKEYPLEEVADFLLA